MRSTSLDFPDVNTKLDGTIVRVTNNVDGAESYHYFDAEYMEKYDGGFLDTDDAVDLSTDDAEDDLPDDEVEAVMGYVGGQTQIQRQKQSQDASENGDVTDETRDESSESEPRRLIDFDANETDLSYSELQDVVSEFDDISGNASTEEMIDGLSEKPWDEVEGAVKTHLTDNSPPPEPGGDSDL